MACWLLLARAAPAHAAGEVTDCSSQNDLAAKMNAGSGLITFNCNGTGDAATIAITQAGGFYAAPGVLLTINGGGVITLTGAGANRLFTVKPGTSLTLTNLSLTDGNASAAGPDLPDQGGALLNEGDLLVLDNVTIYNAFASTSGGAIRAITGTTTIVNDSLIDGGQALSGAGIDSSGALTLTGSIIRNNWAYINDGGGLHVNGTTLISNSQIYSNTAQRLGGGMLNDVGGTAAVGDSQVYSNSSMLSGGGIYNFTVLTLTHSTLAGNQATLDGGGLYNYGTAALSDVAFRVNTASASGGGIGNSPYGLLTLNNVTLGGNSAAQKGGGLNSSGVATLDNVVLNGNMAANGAGIDSDQTATLTLSRVVFSDNVATNGGGLYNFGSLAAIDSTFDGNSAQYGGGLYDGGFTLAVSLSSTTFRGNTAAMHGGGIFNNNIQMLLTRVTLSANSAISNGGGIFNSSGQTFMLAASTLNDNQASNGGGIFNNGGLTTLISSTLSANRAQNSGGGMNNAGAAALTNITVSGNSAQGNGGGIANVGGRLGLENVTLAGNWAPTGGALSMNVNVATYLTNTILAYSPSGGNCSGTLSTAKYSIDDDTTCLVGGSSGNLNVDPRLTALGNYGGPTLVHMLKLGSPAINGVALADAPPTDQRGYHRPIGAYDIGAVERQPNDSDLAPWLYLPLLMR